MKTATIKTVIDRRGGDGRWYWSGTSCTATEDDPCRDHTADLGEAVYDALEDAWADREEGTDEIRVIVDGTEYRMFTVDA